MQVKKSLHFDYSAAADGLYNAISLAADELIKNYENEVSNSLKDKNSKLTNLSENERTIIKRKIIGNSYAVLDSYGTGSLMDKSNPALPDYMKSNLWNELRRSYAIVGRRKGTYTNVHGKKQVSSGKLAGIDVENTVKPRSPSYAFQNADKWFFGGNKINEKINEAIRNWLAGIGQYFTFG